MYRLKLTKGFSYSGVVKATKKAPYVDTEDEATAQAAVASGYFTLVSSAAALSGSIEDAGPDGTGGGENDEDQVTIGDFVGTGDSTDDQTPATGEDEATAESESSSEETAAATPDYEALSALSREELEAYAAEKGIDLTGVKYAKADILQAISKFYGGSDTMMELQNK